MSQEEEKEEEVEEEEEDSEADRSNRARSHPSIAVPPADVQSSHPTGSGTTHGGQLNEGKTTKVKFFVIAARKCGAGRGGKKRQK